MDLYVLIKHNLEAKIVLFIDSKLLVWIHNKQQRKIVEPIIVSNKNSIIK